LYITLNIQNFIIVSQRIGYSYAESPGVLCDTRKLRPLNSFIQLEGLFDFE